MLLHRTDKGHRELQRGVRTLAQRYRSVLLIAQGKPLAQLRPMFGGDGERLALELVRDGYLATSTPAVAAADRPAAPAAAAGPPRSLAGTRMYLFDLCERLFARRDPELAERFRGLLRAARTRASMLAAGDELLLEIGRTAGADRAEAVSARIAQLLPDDDSAA